MGSFEAVDGLLGDTELRLQMMRANHAYYR